MQLAQEGERSLLRESGARCRAVPRPGAAEKQKPGAGFGRAQLVSFNFPNNLICTESSSARVQGA
jgi:hypothetical protein